MARNSIALLAPAFALCVALSAFSCANPFGDTTKSGDEFQIYTSDFSAQNDGGAQAAFLKVIAGAKETLNCAFSALTLSNVTGALVDRARAGVQVSIAFDADVRDSDAGSLALQGSSLFNVVQSPVEGKQNPLLYGNSGAGVMRHNFCLADGKIIYISTAPPDNTQMRNVPNVALKIGSASSGLARDFLREANFFSQLAFGSHKAKTDFATQFTVLNQAIELHWGPQEDPLDVLAAALSTATRSVDFYSTAFQTTNSGKAELDVPRVLQKLESAKGVPLKNYFSTGALFDAASKAFILSNPSQYMNRDVRVGANMFVIDRGLSIAKTFIYTGALRAQANTADDSVLIELPGKYAAEVVGAYLDQIGRVSLVASNSGDVSAAGAVVINEINWMGSYSNALVSDSADEFLELYNTTVSAINISGWKFACTTDGGATVNSYFQMPPGAIIPAGKYFTIAAKATGAFPGAVFYTSQLSITNSSRECKLTNGKGAASSYAGQRAFTGDVIDIAGDNAMAFDNSGGAMGTNDTSGKIRRSAERQHPNEAGNTLAGWRSNSNVVAQNTDIAPQFNLKTFGTPGAAAPGISSGPPAVTHVVVANTNPDNGATPFNTGTATLTIIGSNFSGTTAVNLDDRNGAGNVVETALTSVIVDSDVQVTATVPAGVVTNGTTGWNVKVTTPNGTNASSAEKFLPQAGLLISEVVENGAGGAGNEFIEIYNATGLAIDVGASGLNLRMHIRSSAGADTNKTLSAVPTGCAVSDTAIPAHGFYLIVSSAATAESWWLKRNMTYAAGLTSIGGVYLSLNVAADAMVIDKVGWGVQTAGSPNFEGSATPALSAAKSIERKLAGGIGQMVDTDNNASDFNEPSSAVTPMNCLDAAQR